jgi:hypothetical protein
VAEHILAREPTKDATMVVAMRMRGVGDILALPHEH